MFSVAGTRAVRSDRYVSCSSESFSFRSSCSVTVTKSIGLPDDATSVMAVQMRRCVPE